MEASTLQAPATLPRPRVSIAGPLLRLRSDEQLVALFRAGHDEAFRAIHDRYQKRLFAYARQMLPARQDAEDALQDVFVRAYSGLRASDRELALRAWLFRVAHNRCIDELRRPASPPPEVLQLVRSAVQDPVAEVELRDSVRRLITDVRRLPEQQRSALLLRELGGMSYAELATSLGISIGAVKSVLVRARIGLAQAAEARDTACAEIREELVGAHDRRVRPNANARRHMRDCAGCRGFRRELRGVTRRLTALSPAIGPLAFLAKVLGLSGGAGGGATAGSATAGGATAGGALIAGGGVAASTGGVVVGAGHVATLIAAAVATAGGAVEIQHTISAPPHHHAHVRTVASQARRPAPPGEQAASSAPYEPAASFPPAAAIDEVAASVPPKIPGETIGRSHRLKPSVRQPTSSTSGGGAGIGPATPLPDSTSSATGTGLPTDPALDGTGTATGTGTTGGTPSSTTTAAGSTGGTGTTGSGSGGTSSSATGYSSTGSPSSTGDGTSSSSTTSGTGTTSTSSTSSGTTSGSGTSSSTGSTSSTSSVPTK